MKTTLLAISIGAYWRWWRSYHG